MSKGGATEPIVWPRFVLPLDQKQKNLLARTRMYGGKRKTEHLNMDLMRPQGHVIVFRDGITPPSSGLVDTQLQSSVETCALDTELEALLAKGAVEIVPQHLAESGYYSPYFLVPKKDGGHLLLSKWKLFFYIQLLLTENNELETR